MKVPRLTDFLGEDGREKEAAVFFFRILVVHGKKSVWGLLRATLKHASRLLKQLEWLEGG